MKLTIYYQKIREMVAAITEEFPVVVSTDTNDGGKPGVCTEVPRAVAARMIVEGRARLAHEAEALKFYEDQANAKRIADEEAAAANVKVQVVRVPADAQKG